VDKERFNTSKLRPRLEVFLEQGELDPLVINRTREATLRTKIGKDLLERGGGTREKRQVYSLVERRRNSFEESSFSRPRVTCKYEEAQTFMESSEYPTVPFFVVGIGIKEPRVGGSAEWRGMKDLISCIHIRSLLMCQRVFPPAMLLLTAVTLFR